MSKLMVASAAILALGIASAVSAEDNFTQMETMTTADFVALCRNSTAEQKCNTMLNWVRKDANARRGSCVADSITPTQLRLSIVPELESFMASAPDSRNMRAYQAIAGLMITKYCTH